ncbi:hypothetical protein QFC21_000628 [Naganishia friedmannii]|uniref:Uncharacterized protein n=1 Tax=Naganishia friedmannii TaxID=89922 RepID=A0ACC2WC59_9TREE|nr:hypothetical protein QFC21_000628 [Naganishia friedmannii]
MSSTRATGTATTSIPATAAAGGLTMTQPPSSASASFYKIASANYVTFGWNLTSLYVTPESLTVIATCTQNGNTYKVGPTNAAGEIDNVIPGDSTQIIWNPWEYEQQAGATPLAAATYTLSVWDERGPGATVAAGRFSPYSGTNFALYRPQQYTPLSGEHQRL